MKTQLKAWRVTLILELDHPLNDDDFREFTAHTAGRATCSRGTRKSESAPELSVTTISNAIAETDAVTATVRAVQQRLAILPGEHQILRVRNYLVAA